MPRPSLSHRWRLALVTFAVGLTVAGCVPQPVEDDAPPYTPPGPTGRLFGRGAGDEAPPASAVPEQECLVKGNVSIDSGELIYHVPGQEFYDETVIREEYGERWFCSEEEALAAGWRKSLR